MNFVNLTQTVISFIITDWIKRSFYMTGAVVFVMMGLR